MNAKPTNQFENRSDEYANRQLQREWTYFKIASTGLYGTAFE